MPVNKLFGGSVRLLGQALDLRSQRQGLIQSNIANLETPGYKVQELPFAKVMEKTMATGGGLLTKTHARHMDLDPVAMGPGLEFSGEDRPVDLDEEMVKLSENQLMYQVTTRIITKKFEGIKFVIDEGGR